MQNEWILEVLDDLGAFARSNGLERLAAKLEETRQTAVLELEAQPAEVRRAGD